MAYKNQKKNKQHNLELRVAREKKSKLAKKIHAREKLDQLKKKLFPGVV